MAITKVSDDLLQNPAGTQIDAVNTDIALLGFKVASNGSLAAYDLKDQSIDAFEDASGIDAGTSTGEIRNASNYYSGVSVTPAATTAFTTVASTTWTAPSGATSAEYLVVAGGGGSGGGVVSAYAGGGGGGGGTRQGSLSVTGGTSYTVTVGAGGTAGQVPSLPGGQGGDSVFSTITSTGGGGGGTSAVVGQDGGSGGGSGGGGNGVGSGNTPSTSPSQGANGGLNNSYNAGAGGGGGSTGSNGGGATSTNGGNGGAGYDATGISWIGTSYGESGWFAGGGGGGYRNYHGSTSGTAGQGGGGAGANGGTDGTANTGGGAGGHSMVSNNASNGAVGGSGTVIIHTAAINIYGDMTLVSNSTTAEAAPTKGDVVMTYTNGAGTATVNTDIKAYVSRDNGTTYTQVTLSSEGTTGGHTILTAHDVDISSQPSGTSMRYKIETLNQSVSKETRIQAVSLGWS